MFFADLVTQAIYYVDRKRKAEKERFNQRTVKLRQMRFVTFGKVNSVYAVTD